MIGEKDILVAARMLDLCALRHKLIAHNIANAEVRGFRRLSASFPEELAQAIREGDVEKLKEVKFEISKAERPGVVREREVAEMVKNQLLFDTFARIAAERFKMLRMAVSSK